MVDGLIEAKNVSKGKAKLLFKSAGYIQKYLRQIRGNVLFSTYVDWTTNEVIVKLNSELLGVD